MVLNLFSKRNRKPHSGPLTRDALPPEFRVQVIHIWGRALGDEDQVLHDPNPVWKSILKLPRFTGQVVKLYAAFFFSKQSSNAFGVA
jgi:hypothetical protein